MELSEQSISALREDPPEESWEIQGKRRLDDGWIVLCHVPTQGKAEKIFDRLKSNSGGYYRLLGHSPRRVLSEHPEDLWSLPEKLERLEIASPADWGEYNDYLLEGGRLEYKEWQQTR